MSFALAVGRASRDDFPRLPGATNGRMFAIYGLYKQATTGDCNRARPGILDPVGQSKYDAWDALKGVSRAEAEQRYAELVGIVDPSFGNSRIKRIATSSTPTGLMAAYNADEEDPPAPTTPTRATPGKARQGELRSPQRRPLAGPGLKRHAAARQPAGRGIANGGALATPLPPAPGGAGKAGEEGGEGEEEEELVLPPELNASEFTGGEIKQLAAPHSKAEARKLERLRQILANVDDVAGILSMPSTYRRYLREKHGDIDAAAAQVNPLFGGL